MTITALTIFASAGEKNTTGLSLTDGFPAAQKPARQWFNWLFNTMTAKINEIITATNAQAGREAYAVGDLYLTTIAHADASAVATFHGYGTWARHAEGRALVGLSDNAPDPTWTKTLGSTTGEYEHALTVNEMPPHVHEQTFGVTGLGISNSVDPSTTGSTDGYATTVDYIGTQTAKAPLDTKSTGDGEPFNIVQPSIVIGVWRRTA